MSRLNTKQRRARFRNSEIGKQLKDLNRRKDNYFGIVRIISDTYPLFRGPGAIR